MLNLISGSGSMLLSLTSRAVSQWFLVWLFAYFGGTSEVGEYAQALAITTPIYMIAEGGLRSIIITAVERPSYGRAVRLRLIAVTIATLVSLPLGLLLEIDLLFVLTPLALLKSLDSLIDVPLSYLQAKRQFAATASGGVLNSVSTIAVAAASIGLGSTDFLLWASCIGSAITASIYLLYAARLETGTGPLPQLRKMTLLGLSTGANALVVYAPVLYLGRMGDETAVGVYAVVMQAVSLASIFLSAVQQGILPWLASTRADGGTASAFMWRRARLLMMTIGASLAAGIAVTLPPLTPIIYGSEFQISTLEALPLALCALALASAYYTGAALLVANEYGIQIYAAIASLALITAISLVAAPRDTLLIGTGLAFSGYFTRAVVSQITWRHVAHSRYSRILEEHR